MDLKRTCEEEEFKLLMFEKRQILKEIFTKIILGKIKQMIKNKSYWRLKS